MGAGLGFSSGVHKSGFNGRSLAEDLPLLLTLLSEALTQPAFPKAEVEKLRAQLLTGLAIRAQDTSDMASMLFDEILFKGHPYSRPEDGHPETVQKITRRGPGAVPSRTFWSAWNGDRDRGCGEGRRSRQTGETRA